MERVQMKADKRTTESKGQLRRLRLSGFVPGVIYGRKKEPLPVAVDSKQIARVMHLPSGVNTLIDLQVNGTEDTVMIRDLQRDILLYENYTHVDFIRISLEDKLEVHVPVHLIGEAEGVGDGGLLQQQLREVAVKCLPTAIPEQLELDISSLGLGHSMTVSDLPIPEGMELLTDPNEVIVAIAMPKAADAPEATEEEAEAEENGEEE